MAPIGFHIAGASTSSAVTLPTRSRKLPQFSPGEVVTFIVGKEPGEKFVVHKEHVCFYSEVLNKAFNSEFTEGQTQVYKLDDVTPETFKLAIEWMYTRKLTLATNPTPAATVPDSDEGEALWRSQANTLLQLWILGDRFFIPALQNTALEFLNSIVQGSCAYNVYRFIRDVYERTREKSPLRKYMVKLCIWQAVSVEFTNGDIYTQEILVDMVQAFCDAVPQRARDNRQRFEISEFFISEADD